MTPSERDAIERYDEPETEICSDEEETEMPTFHITKITRRSDRRIMGKIGERVNLCGGAFTDHDVTIADARRIVRSNYSQEGWQRCDACFGRLLDMDFKRSERIED
jgi:hypothetical protein